MVQRFKNGERLRFEAVVRRHDRHGATDGQAAQATQALPQLGGWNARPFGAMPWKFLRGFYTGVGAKGDLKQHKLKMSASKIRI